MFRSRPATARAAGFTLVEVLIALSLLGMLTIMLFTSFHAVVRAWETGRATIDATGHSDYLMDQLAAALRSAYYPGTGEKYGLIFFDDGEGEVARDWIEWTKVGPALVGEDAEFADVPHRIRISVTDEDGRFPGGFTVRAWRQDLQLEDFDPEEHTAELCLSPKVVAFNCRMLDPDQERTVDDEINWIDEWTKTNTLPTALELTLWMKPDAEGEDELIESRRVVEIPMGHLSQNPSLGSSSNEASRAGTSTSVGGGRRRPNRGGNSGGTSGGGIIQPQNPGGGPPMPGGSRPPAPGGGRPGGAPNSPFI